MKSRETVCIGILCQENKPVFEIVGDRLRDAGYTVRFFHPDAAIPAGQVEDLDLLVNKKVTPASFPSLWYAHRTGTSLWNNLTATVLFSSRLIGLRALEASGFRTPPVTFEKPDGDYIAKGAYIWDGEPELNGDGDFYQPLIETEPVDHKYYAVRGESRTEVVSKRVTSKLYGPKRFLGRTQARPGVVSHLRQLVEQFDLSGVGVDLVEDDEGELWAVDVNLAAGYRDSELEPALYRSISTILPDS